MNKEEVLEIYAKALGQQARERDEPTILAFAAALEAKWFKEPDNYVAWCRYVNQPNATRIQLCDSDAPGAFKVYRASPPATDSNEVIEIVKHDLDRDLLP